MSAVAVGIVGFGRIGREHARWLQQCQMTRPVAAADITPASLEHAERLGLRAVQSIEELLADPHLEAILISSPTAFHHQHALTALAAGKHVMIEKPMALNLAQALEISAAAKAAGKLVSVFHNRRFDADYLTVKAAISAGKFGKILNVESRLGQWGSCVGPAAKEWRPGWRNEAAFGGGGLYDWGSHFVDQLWRLMLPAKPVQVFAQLRANVWTTDCDDLARVCINFDSGAVGLVEINTTTTRPLPRWHIDGTAGSAESPFSLEFDVGTWAQLSFQPAAVGASAELLPVAAPGLNECDIWDHFVAAVRGTGAPAISLQSVLPTMALLDAVRQSSRTGATIALPTDLAWIE